MGRDTKIQWCDSTINGSSGCDGCELWSPTVKTCYAGTLQENRLSKSLPALYSKDFKEVRMIPGRFAQAASWPDLRGVDRPDKPWLNGKPRCIFVGDMGDFLSKEVTDDFLEKELLGAITSKQGQRHFWMLLTKRPRRLAKLSIQWGGLPENVMAMTTATDQATLNSRVPYLTQVDCRWRGISVEPLLGSLTLPLHRCPHCGGQENGPTCEFCEREYAITQRVGCIDWIITGGESGADARPMHPDWARDLRDQCVGAGVPFFFKQSGAWSPMDQWAPAILKPQIGLKSDGSRCRDDEAPQDVGAQRMIMLGKEDAGRLLDGREWNEFPAIEGRAA